MKASTYFMNRSIEIEKQLENLNAELLIVNSFLKKATVINKNIRPFCYTPNNLKLFIKLANTTRQNLGVAMGYSSGQILTLATKDQSDEYYQSIPDDKWQRLFESKWGSIVLAKLAESNYNIESK